MPDLHEPGEAEISTEYQDKLENIYKGIGSHNREKRNEAIQVAQKIRDFVGTWFDSTHPILQFVDAILAYRSVLSDQPITENDTVYIEENWEVLYSTAYLEAIQLDIFGIEDYFARFHNTKIIHIE